MLKNKRFNFRNRKVSNLNFCELMEIIWQLCRKYFFSFLICFYSANKRAKHYIPKKKAISPCFQMYFSYDLTSLSKRTAVQIVMNFTVVL